MIPKYQNITVNTLGQLYLILAHLGPIRPNLLLSLALVCSVDHHFFVLSWTGGSPALIEFKVQNSTDKIVILRTNPPQRMR